ncbi:uncharacterized protein LOC111337320 [Stylophora pistillata]|nr:uncharacterized protein LOC111337320 [Stylophora pistillata]
MVRGRVKIDRKLGNLPFRYEVTIKKNGKNLGCSISACNGRLTCSVIKKNLNKNGIICTSKSLNRGSATIKSSPNRSVPGLQTMLGRLGKGKYTITAKLRALKGNKVYGCVQLTTNKRG